MDNSKSITAGSILSLVLAAGLCFAGAQKAAAAEIYNKDGTKIEFTTEIGLGLFHVTQDFGASPLRQPLNNVSWAEGYAIMGFKGEHDLDAHWNIFGNFTAVVNGVRGQGDAIAASIGNEEGGQVQDASGGVEWKSGAEGGASVKISGGRQKWVQGDGFLIGGDTPTPGVGYGKQYDEGGGYYLNPRRVFSQTVILNVETGTPWRFDTFYIDSEKGQNGQRAIGGGDVEYVDTTYGTIGATYIRGLNVEDPQNTVLPFTPATDGMNLYSVHGNTSFGIKDFTLSARYVTEQSSSATNCNAAGLVCTGLDAWAWYLNPSYTFSALPWTPTLYYRFVSFSGDDSKTAANEGYDPLFISATGWNTWFIGEIAANYSGPFNSNANVHSLGLTLAPDIDLGAGKLTGLGAYINHSTRRESAPGASDNFGIEFAAYAEMQLFENMYVAPLYSVLFPEQGYRDLYGNGDTVHNFELMAILTY